jgi:glycosyltransferase involved in cell wall biosynthesis
MRVLVDAVLGPAHPRGVGRYVLELAGHMQRSGEAAVTVAIAPWHRDFYAPLSAVGVGLAEVRVGGRRGLRDAWHLLGVGRLAGRLASDVIHVPDRLPVARAGRPLVITVHDTAEHDLTDAFGPLQLRYRRLVLADQLRRATRIIAPSTFSARRIAALAPAATDRTTVVMHGAGLDPAQPQVQPEQVGNERFILYVGAVQRHKGVPHLVRAFRALGATDVGLVLAGAVHNDEAAVEAAIGGDSRIVRLRNPRDAVLAWLYRHAVALAVPSRYEGFCFPLVEAMQLGCPVLAADAGAMPEICGDAALLFAPTDETALTAQLARVLADDGLRARLSAAGRERAAAFSWERAAHETISVYRAALAHGEAV